MTDQDNAFLDGIMGDIGDADDSGVSEAHTTAQFSVGRDGDLRAKKEELFKLKMERDRRWNDMLDKADKAAGRKPGMTPFTVEVENKKKKAATSGGLQKIEDIVSAVFGGTKLPEVGTNLPKRAVLKIDHRERVDIAPSGGETYAKSSQTPPMEGLPPLPDPTALQEKATKEEAAQPAKEEAEADKKEEKDEDAEENGREEKTGKKKKRNLTAAQKKKVMQSEPFEKFFDSASKIVERQLNLEADEETYVKEDAETIARRKHVVQMRAALTEDVDVDDGSLKLKAIFFSDKWSRHRSVTDLAACHHFPELFLSSYNANEGDVTEPGGAVLVWSLYNHHRPEFAFHCQSPVVTASFIEYQPALIMGGTKRGQVVIWDRRVNQRTPVQYTPLSPVGHTHPVYCASLVGTANANNIVAISNDGRMCSWTLNMLSKPQDTIELLNKQLKKPASVTAMDFPHRENNNVIVGTEDGSVYSAFRHGNKQGLDEEFGQPVSGGGGTKAHHAMVTSVDVHPANGTHDFKDLVLTSSLDWTIKLWSRVNPDRPIHVMDGARDYVYDVKWSPQHPAVLASADGSGCLSVWNLNYQTEIPATKVLCGDGLRSCSKVCWSHDGSHLLVGDSVGVVRMFKVANEVCSPHADEWSVFESVLTDLRDHDM